MTINLGEKITYFSSKDKQVEVFEFKIPAKTDEDEEIINLLFNFDLMNAFNQKIPFKLMLKKDIAPSSTDIS